jgi:hypothetical protein
MSRRSCMRSARDEASTSQTMENDMQIEVDADSCPGRSDRFSAVRAPGGTS